MRLQRLVILAVLGLAGCETTESISRPTTRVEPARPVVASSPVPPTVAVWPATAPDIRATSAIMIDARTGRTLYQKFADERRQVASTQKLLTALVVVDGGDLGSTVRIAREDTLVEPTKLGVRAGQTYSRMALLSAMLVKSENDAAAALARDHSGGVDYFAAEMNRKARELGAYDSYFLNPHGLPAPQYSTARDMAKIAFSAYHNSFLRQIMATQYLTFTFADGRSRRLESTNKLLGRSSIFNGMKTGFTNAAGRCLVSSASFNGRDVILVQLGSKTSYIFNDAERMMRWGLEGAPPLFAASN